MNPTVDPTVSLPQCIEAEQTILGSILLNASVVDDLAGELDPAHFHLGGHRSLFSAMVEIRTDAKPINLVTLSETLRRAGKFEQVGGATYIASLIDHGTHPDTIPHYTKLVKEKAQLRRLIAAANTITSRALEQDEPVETIQEQAERLIAEVRSEENAGGFQSAGELAYSYLEDLEQADGRGPSGIKTGLRDVDRDLVSLEPGTVTIIGARPSQGKTAMGLTILLNAAAAGGIGAFFSLEMSSAQIMQRLLAMFGRIELGLLRGHHKLNREDWAKLSDAQRGIAKLGINIDATRGLTASQVCARLRRLHHRKPVSFAIVDFLTRLRFNSKRDLRHELGDSVKAFKDLAGELGIPIVALSQLSRANVAGGRIRPPQLSDLRESGNLEEDSDCVLFIHREEAYGRTDSNEGKASIIIAKQRQGPAPESIEVSFLGSFVKFENLWRY